MTREAVASAVADQARLRELVRRHILYTLGLTVEQLTPRDTFRAVGFAVRDLMVERLLATRERYQQADSKRLYYLSLEFLIGRSLHNNLANLGLLQPCAAVLAELGTDLAAVEECEVDAALGNGGLGRLAACFLDSLATLDLPGFGYGINYEYGLFKQEIKNGQQIEKPDNWRTYHTPWEIERPQDAVLVPLYGRIEHVTDRFGNYNPMWLDWKVVIGVPHDMPIVGYGGQTVNYLRLYTARASHEVDMGIFNEGDYLRAVNEQVQSETISKVLYPTEAVAAGRELRFVQEYFLVACAVRDIVRRYCRTHQGFDAFPDKVAIQLNDTHPALTIAELMRILIDENDLPWEKAWAITSATCAYTNHTLLPEALERWPVSLVETVLPRHLQIIYEINRRFLETVEARWPGDVERSKRMSLIEENPTRQVRMAHLAIAGSHSINGVAAVHSRLVKTELVPDFAALWPERFNNKTNGVTQRRWLLSANPELARLITQTVGERWITDLDHLRNLEPLAGDARFQDEFRAVKRRNKERLVSLVRDTTGLTIDPDSLFDVHVKRIHEYKRQLLNVLHIVHQYLSLIEDRQHPPQPRTWVFAGKAAPGYHVAKQIIQVICAVAETINNDRRAKDYFKVVFVPDYRVSLAEVIIPAADLSEQISTAGTEASGTSNMKFALNGAPIIGTLDGANIEIGEEVGADNIFIFGLTVAEVRRMGREGGNRPRSIYQQSPLVKRILDAFKDNRFSTTGAARLEWVYHRLLTDGEPYYHVADLEAYVRAQQQVTQMYGDRAAWTAKAILNTARIGKFSSDRTIREYAQEIWNLRPVR